MKNVNVWSRSSLELLFLPGAGAGAAQKSGGSATLDTGQSSQ